MYTEECSIIGCLAGGFSLDEQAVAALIALPPLALSHGAAFTGKPTTSIHANEQWVLKLDTSRGFQNQQIAASWCRKRIQQEQDYAIYHPLRTWLTVQTDDHRWLAANVTPRLLALHMVDWVQEDEPMALISQVIEMYCRFSATFERRLDEGLSNFGAQDGKVWYMDDDLFLWDEHASFIAMICGWLRAHYKDWMSVENAFVLGQALRSVLLDCRTSLDVEIICMGINDQFVGSLASAAQQALIQGLRCASEQQQCEQQQCEQQKGGEPSQLDWQRPMAILADVHGNLPALERVLAVLDARGVDQILLLGDLVGYGVDAMPCIRLMHERNAVCIRGNHDHYIANHGAVKIPMSQSAKQAADWTLTQLSDDILAWLGGLPLKLEHEGVLALHGSPCDRTFINGYVYEMTYEKNLSWLKEHDMHICFHGHSHLQGIYSIVSGDERPICRETVQDLSKYEHCLVNPGSVGQPRTGEPGADFAIYDPISQKIELLHESYDVTPLLRRMRQADMPEQLLKRLVEGF